MAAEEIRNDTISMMNQINREDVLEYINIIVEDIFKEVFAYAW